MTPDEEQLKKELTAVREQLDRDRESYKNEIESLKTQCREEHKEAVEDLRDSYGEAIQHFKLRQMTRVYEGMADILKMESAINDPKSLFSRRQSQT